MTVAQHSALSAEKAPKTKYEIAEERETAFREAERARTAANHTKTARLKALRLASQFSGVKEVESATRRVKRSAVGG